MSKHEHTGRICPQQHQQILTGPLPRRCQLALGESDDELGSSRVV